MTPDQERWSEELMVNRIHDSRGPRHVVERITALTLAGDDAGVAAGAKSVLASTSLPGQG